MKTEQILVVVGAIFGCTGFWTFIQALMLRRLDRESLERKALLGLLHDRIYSLCREYINRGGYTVEEYRNLVALYEPYIALGGNGTAKALKEEIDKLSIRG